MASVLPVDISNVPTICFQSDIHLSCTGALIPSISDQRSESHDGQLTAAFRGALALLEIKSKVTPAWVERIRTYDSVSPNVT